jgi:hypothetical protein
MPEKKTVKKAKRALRKGKSPSTAAGEFVREEIHHVREGKHGARSTKQAIAIGLSKARRAGVPLEPPARGTAKKKTRKAAERDLKAGKRKRRKVSKKRSRASKRALKREGRRAASKKALSRHAKRTSEQRRRTRARNAAKKKSNSRKKSQRRAA